MNLSTAGRQVLGVEGLSVNYRVDSREVGILRDVTFDVCAGEIVGVVGESGCGKSTLVKSILSLLPSNAEVVAGSVDLAGVTANLVRMSNRDLRLIRGARLGYIGQNPFAALNPILRIEKQFYNVLAAHRQIGRREAATLASSMLASLGISDPKRVLRSYPHQLSGGMIQRVVMGLAFILEPAVVVADEPTTGLDVTVQRQVLDLIRGYTAGTHMAMVLVTHDLGVVAHYCDRVQVMYAGRIVESGPVARVFRQPAHPYTLGLLRSVPGSGFGGERMRDSVSSMSNQPRGCPFHPRCSQALDSCLHDVPDLEPVEPGHQVACFVRGGVDVRADA